MGQPDQAVNSCSRWAESLNVSKNAVGPGIGMHEQSLVEHLLDEVDRLAQREGALAVVEVELEIGPLAGVEPALLLSAFEWLAPQRFGRAVALSLVNVSLQARCATCQLLFEPAGFRLACPACGSVETEIVQGDACLLRRVVCEIPNPEPAAPR